MIPVFDLSRQSKTLLPQYQASLEKVINGGVLILGNHVTSFENQLAKYVGSRFAVGVASGTDAITLALLSLDLKKDDEVIMPANSYPSVFGVAQVATPRLVDVKPGTFTIDPEKIEEAISTKTKALFPVHLYGQAADMEAIQSISNKYGIPIVEDCAQAIGAEVHVDKTWKKVGSIGALGCFSFYPTKNLGALGDGGVVTTNDEKLYQKLKLLRMYGEKERYQSVLVGKNSRLDELQAAFLVLKLTYLDKWIRRRIEIAKLYDSSIKNSSIRKPEMASYARHTYHLYVISTNKRNELKKYLEDHAVGTAIHYPKPIHLQSSFNYLNKKIGDFPVSEKSCDEVLSLPMFPELTDDEASHVAVTLSEFSS